MSIAHDRQISTPERKDSGVHFADEAELRNIENDGKGKQLGKCYLDLMPLEVKTRIFKYLSDVELVRISRVNRSWYRLAFDGSLWSVIDARPFYQEIAAKQLVKLIVSAGSFLKVLNLRGCIQLKSLNVYGISTFCPNIQSLHLSGCRSLDSASIADILSKLNNLENLDLSGLLFIINPHCEILGKHCRKLKKVNLSWCQYINSQGIEALVDGCTELINLKINGLPKLNETALAKIGMLKNLRVLSLDACPTLTDSHITALLRGDSQYPEHDPPPLTHLNLSNNHNLTDVALDELSERCPQLTHLQLHSCSSLAEEGLIRLSQACTKIEALDLEDILSITDRTLHSFASNLPNLKICCLSYCEQITDEGVIDLFRSCPYLSHIDLDHCQLLTDAILSNLTTILTRDGSKRNRNVQVEIFDCRNITVSAVKDAIRKVSGAGVILKVKGYYSWQASNADDEEEDSRRNANGQTWLPRRLLRPFGGRNEFIRIRLPAANGLGARGNANANGNANAVSRWGGFGRCTIL
ncbi:1172_t:CDS:2 [Paraglomus occultum]|uniref:1172_t:CDS:1 n=1 Tax=Paraglomus occultum TaxID=144539 RepID=A0A9N9AKW1_9GLOM|nr:1172_t:CDS:2 [Paraglomus occultum]